MVVRDDVPPLSREGSVQISEHHNQSCISLCQAKALGMYVLAIGAYLP